MNKYSGKNSCNIISSASIVPGEALTTEKMLSKISDKMSDELLSSIHNIGVESRNSVIDDYLNFLLKTKDRKLISSTTDLGVQVVEKCMKSANVDLSKIKLLITITNTSDRHLPCFGYELLSKLSHIIPRDLNVINMQDQGCATLLKGVEIAQQYLNNDPDQYVLLVASESNTAFFPALEDNYHSLHELKNIKNNTSELLKTLAIIENFLFGDGAVGMLLGVDPKYSSLGQTAHVTNIEDSDTDVIHMDEGGVLIPVYKGYPHYIMTPAVPKRGAFYAKKLTDTLFEHSDLPLESIDAADWYLIHTGSKKILTGVCETMQIDPSSERVATSFEILRNHGNLSSASIGFMIDKSIREEKKGTGLMVSFGVGFSGSAGIIEFR